MKKIIKNTVLMLFMAIIIVGTSTSTINAKEISERQEIKEQLLNIGVKEEKVDVLVSKLVNGEPLDSMKEEYDYIEPSQEVLLNDYYEATYVYPDGSIKTVSITPAIVNGTITGGTHTSGGYWYSWINAKVIASWGVITASFYADFNGSTGSGQITAIRDWGIIIAGGTFQMNSFSIVNANATASTPAQARLFFTATVVGDFAQATFYLRLYVPKGSNPYAQFSILN